MNYWVVLYAALGGAGILALAAVAGFVVLSRDINRKRGASHLIPR
jgi:hypothetical protein